MTNQERWNLIVSQYESLFNEPESAIQSKWEDYCSELLGYKKLLGEVDSQRSVHIGSSKKAIPDIILRKDNADIFDIELKRYCLPFDISFQEQLISYLKLTNISVGMIVCNDIFLYHYDYTNNVICHIQIEIKKDNPDGIFLLELISKQSFSKDGIKSFIDETNKKERDIAAIKESLNPQYIKDLVSSDLSKKFPESTVMEALKNISFSLKTLPNNKIMMSDSSNSNISKPDNVNSIKIASCIKNWCRERNNDKQIKWDESKTNNTYFRFTTDAMDSIIPCSDTGRSGWGNNHYYYYEIHYQKANNSFKMQLAFSHRNASKETEDAFSKVFSVTSKTPNKDNWEWRIVLSSRTISCDTIVNDADMFNCLDELLESIMKEEKQIVEMLS